MKSLQLWEEPDLTPDTKIVRYMRLSAFLSLLKGRIFIPMLRTLQQELDPTEGLLTSTFPNFVMALGAFAASENLSEWLHPAEYESIKDIHSKAFKTQALPDVVELTSRLEETRAVLCFHRQPAEVMAMWQIYARDGVAIETTPRQLDKAVTFPAGSYPHLAKINYHNEGDQDLEKRAIPLIARPYLFKLKCYEFEDEVRLGMVTKLSAEKLKGVHLDVDARSMITGVRLSPFMHRTEAKDIISFCQPLLPGCDIRQSSKRNIFPAQRYGVPFPASDLSENA